MKVKEVELMTLIGTKLFSYPICTLRDVIFKFFPLTVTRVPPPNGIALGITANIDSS